MNVGVGVGVGVYVCVCIRVHAVHLLCFSSVGLSKEAKSTGLR